MDITKRKKKCFEFAEGHKRETRKSYQSFIESSGNSLPSLSTAANEIGLEGHLSLHKCENMADEGVRKSSRRPVPKKSFDLVDAFEGDSSLLKHAGNDNQKKLTTAVNNAVDEFEDLSIKQEPLDDDTPRKSSRVPVPKKSFDLIDSSVAHNFSSGVTTLPLQNITPAISEVRKTNQLKKSKSQKSDTNAVKITEKNTCKQSKKSMELVTTAITQAEMGQIEAVQRETKRFELDKREKSKFTLKLDFKGKREKGSRKRKMDPSIGMKPSVEDAERSAERPREKVTKKVADDIDQSVLMEALQALKQETEDQPTALRKAKLQQENQTEGFKQAEENRQKSEIKKVPSKIKKEPKADCKNPEYNIEERKEEMNEVSKIKNECAESSEKARDYSSSTTETSDGHIILRLGGLQSPTKSSEAKAKKHKKRNKHGHHETKMSSCEAEKGKKNIEANVIKNVVNAKATPFISMSAAGVQNETQIKAPEISVGLGEFQEKRGRSHKKKRKLSQDKEDEDSEKAQSRNISKQEDLIVKKRKIYKKKKGEKILVRIQTEFWNKSGELVKVEPKDVNDGSQNETQHKKFNKLKKKKNLESDTLLSKSNLQQTREGATGGHTGMKEATEKESHLKQNLKKKQKKQLSSTAQQMKSASLKKAAINTKGNVPEKKATNASNKKKKERKTQTLTAYLLYCRKYRPKVVYENPDIGL